MKRFSVLGLVGVATVGLLSGCATGPAPDQQACSILFDSTIIEGLDSAQMGEKFAEYAKYAEDTQLAAALEKAAESLVTEDADSVQLSLVEAGSKCVDLGYGTAD